jgi:hypothetical protein
VWPVKTHPSHSTGLESKKTFSNREHFSWHSSPEFFIARVRVLLVFALFAYAWCRWGCGQKGFSPLPTRPNLNAGVLRAHRICLWSIHDSAEAIEHHCASFCRPADILLAMLALSLLRTSFRDLKFYQARVRPSHLDRVC